MIRMIRIYKYKMGCQLLAQVRDVESVLKTRIRAYSQ